MTEILKFILVVSSYVGFVVLVAGAVYGLIRLMSSQYFDLDDQG